jgi:hypothetical protein
MKTHSVGYKHEGGWTDGRTDLTTFIDAFRNFVKTSTNHSEI